MNGFEVYQMYLSLKQHFTKEQYDYFRYGGKTRARRLPLLNEKDSYFFKKLATRYAKEDLLYYLVANFITDFGGYVRNFSDDVYKKWKINQESFTYKFKQDVEHLLDEVEAPYEENFDKLFRTEPGKHPILLKVSAVGSALETWQSLSTV